MPTESREPELRAEIERLRQVVRRHERGEFLDRPDAELRGFAVTARAASDPPPRDFFATSAKAAAEMAARADYWERANMTSHPGPFLYRVRDGATGGRR